MTLAQVYSEIARLHRENDMFTAEQCRQVNNLIDKANAMTSKPVKGRPVTKDGKTKFIAAKPRQLPALAAGKRRKADRAEAGLRKNREAKRA